MAGSITRSGGSGCSGILWLGRAGGNKLPTAEELKCAVCGKKFDGWSSQKYCSPPCNRRAYYQNNQEKLLEDRRKRYRDAVLKKRANRKRVAQ